jgi:hypothetical protein
MKIDSYNVLAAGDGQPSPLAYALMEKASVLKTVDFSGLFGRAGRNSRKEK